MFELFPRNQFRKDCKKLSKQGKDLTKLDTALRQLADFGYLPSHELKGNWKGYRDHHIEPNWLLLFKVIENQVVLERTGSHSELFD